MTTSTEESTEVESITLTRPDGISDVRWETIQTMAHLVTTGHAPWCREHQNEDEYGGYCQDTVISFCADVVISNGSTDGRTLLSLHLSEGVDRSSLSIPQALAIAVTLTQAAETAQHFNLTTGMSE